MNTQEILNLFLILGILIISTGFVFIAFYLIQALRSITQLTEDLSDITGGIKDKVQMKALTVIPSLLIALISKVMKKRRG